MISIIKAAALSYRDYCEISATYYRHRLDRATALAATNAMSQEDVETAQYVFDLAHSRLAGAVAFCQLLDC